MNKKKELKKIQDILFLRAVRQIVKSLKIWPEYQEVLARGSYEPKERKELLRYARQADIRFGTLPRFIEEKLEKYMLTIEKIAEYDIAKKEFGWHGHGEGDALEIGVLSQWPYRKNRACRCKSKKGKKANKNTLKIARFYFSFHRFEEGKINQGQGGGAYLSGDFFYSRLSRILNILDFDYAREAVINWDRIHPKQFNDVCRLLGYLRIHNWQCVLETEGRLLTDKVKFSRLVYAGARKVHLMIDADRMQKIGMKRFVKFLRSVDGIPVILFPCYFLKQNEESRYWLQKILSSAQMNGIISSMFISNKADYGDLPLSNESSWHPPKGQYGLVLNDCHRICLCDHALREAGSVSLRDSLWEEKFLKLIKAA